MDPITIVLAVVGIAAGYGVSTVQSKRKMSTAEEQVGKELKKAKREAEKQVAEAREEALKIAESQIEMLKNLQRNNLEGTGTEPNGFKDVAGRLAAQPFCMDASTYKAIVFTLPPDGWNTNITSDQLQYPSGCDSIGPGGLYNVAIVAPADSAGGAFKVYVRWEKINGGTKEQVTLEYKLYEAN